MRFACLLASLLVRSNHPVEFLDADVSGTGHATILFTGTRTIKDFVVDDLDVRPSRWRGKDEELSLVHRGFARRTLNLLSRHHDFVQRNDDFLITGHSLGGACAFLAASEVTKMEKRVRGVYAFGSPRLAGPGFCRLYSSQNLSEVTFNFATRRDPVVHEIPKLYRKPVPYIILESSLEKWQQHDMETYRDIVCGME